MAAPPSLESVEAITEAAAKKCVVHFAASWYEPCTHMNALLAARLAKDQKLDIFTIDTDAVPAAAEAFSLKAVPTFIAFKDGKEQERLEESDPPALIALCDKYAVATVGGTGGSGSAKAAAQALDGVQEDLQMKLEKLTKRAPVMLFMKGSPENAKCKFSKQTVALLAEQGIVYDSFDILGDDEVRQGLKTYSDWPTYPQLYHNGTFIGGIDVLNELAEDDGLEDLKAAMAAPANSLDDRLRSLTSRSPVMLFMKGDPSQPKCGFSNTICGLLTSKNITFDSFDILEDEEVRAGLKVFSNWPTFPQLYAKGTLIGGLDIVQELANEDELLEALGLE